MPCCIISLDQWEQLIGMHIVQQGLKAYIDYLSYRHFVYILPYRNGFIALGTVPLWKGWAINTTYLSINVLPFASIYLCTASAMTDPNIHFAISNAYIYFTINCTFPEVLMECIYKKILLPQFYLFKEMSGRGKGRKPRRGRSAARRLSSAGTQSGDEPAPKRPRQGSSSSTASGNNAMGNGTETLASDKNAKDTHPEYVTKSELKSIIQEAIAEFAETRESVSEVLDKNEKTVAEEPVGKITQGQGEQKQSYVEIELPLDARVSLKLRQKILNEEFVEFSSLLKNEMHEKHQLSIKHNDEGDPQLYFAPPASKKVLSFGEWQQAIRIYS
ncbi:unnamed protein product, partial [Owenia fusiformis]